MNHTWRRTKPNASSTASSWRRRRTELNNVCTRVAAARNASNAPSTVGRPVTSSSSWSSRGRPVSRVGTGSSARRRCAHVGGDVDPVLEPHEEHVLLRLGQHASATRRRSGTRRCRDARCRRTPGTPRGRPRADRWRCCPAAAPRCHRCRSPALSSVVVPSIISFGRLGSRPSSTVGATVAPWSCRRPEHVDALEPELGLGDGAGRQRRDRGVLLEGRGERGRRGRAARAHRSSRSSSSRRGAACRAGGAGWPGTTTARPRSAIVSVTPEDARPHRHRRGAAAGVEREPHAGVGRRAATSRGRAARTATGVRRRTARWPSPASTRHAASTRSPTTRPRIDDRTEPERSAGRTRRPRCSSAVRAIPIGISGEMATATTSAMIGRDHTREQARARRRASTARGVPSRARAARCRHAPPRRPGAAGPGRR